MHTPHKAKKQLNKAFLLQLKSQNETKVKVEIRHLTNFCNKMPCVLNLPSPLDVPSYAFG